MSEYTPIVYYEATLIAPADKMAACADLDLDFMPPKPLRKGSVPQSKNSDIGSDGSVRVDVLLEPDQINPLLDCGVLIILRAAIDPKFPQDLIMAPEDMAKKLKKLISPE